MILAHPHRTSKLLRGAVLEILFGTRDVKIGK